MTEVTHFTVSWSFYFSDFRVALFFPHVLAYSLAATPALTCNHHFKRDKMDPHDEKADRADEISEKEIAQSNYNHVDDPVLERKIVAHLDRRILPWIFLLWLLAFIDRSNVRSTSQLNTALPLTKSRSATRKSMAS